VILGRVAKIFNPELRTLNSELIERLPATASPSDRTQMRNRPRSCR